MPERSSTSRRGFLGWMGRVGVGVVGTVAGLAATQQPAAADGNCNRTPACCCLKRLNDCSGTGGNFICPDGWTKRSWTCCRSGALYGCGECQKGGTSCWNGTVYICSKYWIVANPAGCGG